MKFYRYHGLGNDYLVIDERDLEEALTARMVERICHRNFGVGSDGIILYQGKSDAGFLVRIFNPDGSEAENSGNGMRIFSRFLYDAKEVGNNPFSILVKGERKLVSEILPGGEIIKVDLGRASFSSLDIPVVGPEREVINEEIELLGESLTYSSVSVGNPHCVIFGRRELKEDVLRFGPLLETHERFPKRTNVQFASIIDKKNIKLEIWERGAGYTLASGSSSSAVAAAARKLGLTDASVTMHMPGGKLHLELDSKYNIKIAGAVTKIAEGQIDQEMFEWTIAK